MRRLTVESFPDLFEHTAFRLETRPSYLVDYEQPSVANFLAGEPRPVTEIPQYAAWLALVRGIVSQGRHVVRVRVFEEPPTDYQRWVQWAGRWNVEAGEHIRYMPRSRAAAVGLPLVDWWLFDSDLLALTHVDEDGRPVRNEIIDDPGIVARYSEWRDLAVRHSTPDQPGQRLSAA